MIMATDRDEGKIWTTVIDNNGNETTTSRVATASASKRNLQIDDNPHVVVFQSRFRRKCFHRTILISLVTVILLLVIGIIVLATFRHKDALCDTKDCLQAAANLLQSMDQSVDPCQDFYSFTCGNWAKDHPRPDLLNSFNWFKEKHDKILRTIRLFLQSNASDDDPESVKQSKDMYQACMDIDAMDKVGLQPIFDYLKEFQLSDFPQLMNVSFGNVHKFNLIDSLATIKKLFGTDYIVGFRIFPDPSNSSINRIALGSPEAGSPLDFLNDYDNLLKKIQRGTIEKSEDQSGVKGSITVKAYSKYMIEIMKALILYKYPKANLQHINYSMLTKVPFKINIAISEFLYEAINSTVKNLENPFDDLVSLTVDQLQNATDRLIAPKTFPIWRQYLTTIFEGIPNAELDLDHDLIYIAKSDIFYFGKVFEFVLNNATNEEMEFHVWWSVVEELILHTTSDIRKLHNNDITELKGSNPRSLYCASGVNQLVGMAVSYAITDDFFLTHTKPMVLTMLNNIREAFNNLVRQTEWMDDRTKSSTLEKSKVMKSLIGFPEWILDKEKLDEFYGDMHLNATTHLSNMMYLLRWKMNETLNSYRTINEFGWNTRALTTDVNAFYAPSDNTITIPLGILQYPFYNLGLESLNYGAIGTILGHELTHGFDDTGRVFDKEGNMKQWWSNRTIQEYVNRSTCFIKQYSEYYLPEAGDYLNGELTLGENIADNGGLREAYYAYQLYEKEFGKEPQLVGFENYTQNQLFFISYGNLWCETITPTSAKLALTDDEHSPGKNRVNGVLLNTPEFSETFGCKPNSAMNPKDRCRVW